MSYAEIERFRAMRERAYQLADTGDYADWTEIKTALRTERFDMPAIEQRGDKLFHELVTARCRRTRSNFPFSSMPELQPIG